jgi:single-stranded-DNA-specific exonuclease
LQYKLYDTKQQSDNVVVQVLYNRGVSDPLTYLHLKDNTVIPFGNLDNIHYAVRLFLKHFEKNHKIEILVDSDPDGFCSAAMMFSYIKRVNAEYPVQYILHTRPKAHGLTDDITIAEDTRLLIIPDASTNDTKQCKSLTEKGIDVLILDHHEKETENPYAIIVNNQTSDGYANKDFCGAGIVYKFLQALDEEMWNDFANDYLDLCALANIADVMDIRSFETRYLIDCGLKNIRNKFFKALIKAQDYSINGKINIHNVQWYLVPVLNGMVRVGSVEEKDLMFRAFIEQDEFFEYKKRATKDKPAETIQESIYDRAARLCKNAKARQDKMKDKGFQAIVEIIGSAQDENQVVMCDTTEVLDEGLTGVVAMKVADKYKKPCILLNKYFDKEIGLEVFSGSARNINHSPIVDFKKVVNSTGFIKGQGHANAFGIVALPITEFNHALESLNYILRDTIYDSTYYVDYIMNFNDVNIKFIMDLAVFENLIGQGVEEPIIAVEQIDMYRDEFVIFGKNEDTISFAYNDIKYVQFKCKEGNGLYDFLQNAWSDDDCIKFNIVGKPSINDYKGVKTPQIVIADVEVVSTCIVDTSAEDDDAW